MNDPVIVSMIVGGSSAVLMVIVLAPIVFLFDRIVVGIDNRLGKKHFLLARQIATELRRAPNEWIASSGSLHHPALNIKLEVLTSGWIYAVRTSAGSWGPNIFEKRILANAVRWRIRQKLGEMILQPAKVSDS